jgi:hypothetical protein
MRGSKPEWFALRPSVRGGQAAADGVQHEGFGTGRLFIALVATVHNVADGAFADHCSWVVRGLSGLASMLAMGVRRPSVSTPRRATWIPKLTTSSAVSKEKKSVMAVLFWRSQYGPTKLGPALKYVLPEVNCAEETKRFISAPAFCSPTAIALGAARRYV